MVLQSLKKLQFIEKFKKKKKKKNCKYKISKTVCRNFLKDKWVSRYLTFGDFSVPENCSPQSF